MRELWELTKAAFACNSWVFGTDNGAAVNCVNRCATNCASGVNGTDAFRRAVFGVTQ